MVVLGVGGVGVGGGGGVPMCPAWPPCCGNQSHPNVALASTLLLGPSVFHRSINSSFNTNCMVIQSMALIFNIILYVFMYSLVCAHLSQNM